MPVRNDYMFNLYNRGTEIEFWYFKLCMKIDYINTERDKLILHICRIFVNLN